MTRMAVGSVIQLTNTRLVFSPVQSNRLPVSYSRRGAERKYSIQTSKTRNTVSYVSPGLRLPIVETIKR